MELRFLPIIQDVREVALNRTQRLTLIHYNIFEKNTEISINSSSVRWPHPCHEEVVPRALNFMVHQTALYRQPSIHKFNGQNKAGLLLL